MKNRYKKLLICIKKYVEINILIIIKIIIIIIKVIIKISLCLKKKIFINN
jgi:hypothetical protein